MFRYLLYVMLVLALSAPISLAGHLNRVGTTAANFLEIGYGSKGNSMGDAYVSLARDLSSVYWNPAGLGYMENNEFLAHYQPWFADVNGSFVGISYVNSLVGNFALSVIGLGYGDEAVTTVDRQEGTGEEFNGQDLCVTLSYGRRLAEWFSFGASGKFIHSRIWHTSAKAAAMDLGVIINTEFLSPTGSPKDGLNIGACISDYGGKMRFDGIDLKQQIDIIEDENGNYPYSPVRHELKSWEIPLYFRLGVSFHPVVTSLHRFTLSVDALHVNNNGESINMGSRYEFKIRDFGVLSLRGGYKGLFLKDSEYGFSAGAGVKKFYMNNKVISFDYAYRDLGLLGDCHSYTMTVSF